MTNPKRPLGKAYSLRSFFARAFFARSYFAIPICFLLIGIEVIGIGVIGIGRANADTVTFDVSGMFSSLAPVNLNSTGTITIDESAGLVTAADVTLTGHFLSGQPTSSVEFTSFSQNADVNRWALDLFNPTVGDFLLEIQLVHPAMTLVGYSGGIFDPVFVGPGFSACPQGTCVVGTSGTLTAETPLPDALALFAAGIGGLCLLGWHRRRKAQVDAANIHASVAIANICV